MKTIVIDHYGKKEELKERDMPIPDIKDNQVLVETYATSVNPVDWKIRAGNLKGSSKFEFPIILGWDVSGVVSKVGSEVKKFKVGDKVFARPITNEHGTYAEYVAVDENLLAYIPENLTFEEAASVPLACLTAWQSLVDFAQINAGQKVLVHAGAGGVGIFAIQIAKYFGAYVATTVSDGNADLVKSLGADLVIDYNEKDFEKELQGYDIVLDTMGGDIQDKSFNILKKGGVLVSIAEPPSQDKAKQHGVKAGFVWLSPNGEQLQKISDLMQQGKIRTVVGHLFNFTEKEVQEAHGLSETHHARGKIVIKVK